MEDGIQNKLFEVPSRKLTLKKREPSEVADNPSFISHKYAVCLVNLKALGVKTFSYLIPPEMQSKIKIGQALLVPFGRQGLINAFCVGFSEYLPPEIRAKKVNKILDETPLFSVEYLKLLEWVANYYCSDLITVLNTAIPLKLIEKSLKTEQIIEFVKTDGATKRQLEILEQLKTLGKISLIDFEKKAKTTRATIKKLETLGCIKLTEEQIYRNPLDILHIDKKEDLFTLSETQQKVYEGISEQIKIQKSPQILLHGVTASGKTEVYFKLIDDTIKAGKNVLFLAPEIALASQLTKRLAKKFGTQDVAIWHSSISEGERYDVWQKLYKNEIKILAGARSAVFAPLKDIGLIIIDEEHESAYKQTSPAPRYDARLVAKKLAEFNNCPLILGSATPDISSYYRAVNSNHLFEMLKRYNNAKVAPVTVINMQEYGRAAYKNQISKPLQTAIQETLDNNQQVILLINRRGYSTYTQCQGCGHVIECPNCAIPMIWHAKDKMLKCHYCNHVEYFPDVCPNCGFEGLKNSGTGTQKIEQLIKELYPSYNVERIDSDVLVRKGEHIRLLEKFQRGDIDILVGTQMIAKGHDFPRVTLVGIVLADVGLSMPSFRSSERVFQLITQAIGRSGRSDLSGKAIIQTYLPNHYSILLASKQNYDAFFNYEMRIRHIQQYPPFSFLLSIEVSAKNEEYVILAANDIVNNLNSKLQDEATILGPVAPYIAYQNNTYKRLILIKYKNSDKIKQEINKLLETFKFNNVVNVKINVDPYDF